jgi:hypothetical protein
MSRQFLAWGAEAARSLDAGLSLSEFRRSERGLRALQRWMDGHFAHLRAHPGDNILSTLVHAQAAEGKLTRDELTATAMLLLAAGFETTVNLIGNGTALLIEHPEQRERLRASPLWTNAVDDAAVRPPCSAPGAWRSATPGGGRAVPGAAGDDALFGGANRDPEVSDEPQRSTSPAPNAGEHVAFPPASTTAGLRAGADGGRGGGLRALPDWFPDPAPRGRHPPPATRVLRGTTCPCGPTAASVRRARRRRLRACTPHAAEPVHGRLALALAERAAPSGSGCTPAWMQAARQRANAT